jgi:hypothetical protein
MARTPVRFQYAGGHCFSQQNSFERFYGESTNNTQVPFSQIWHRRPTPGLGDHAPW